jgi:hypothetical protein
MTAKVKSTQFLEVIPSKARDNEDEASEDMNDSDE